MKNFKIPNIKLNINKRILRKKFRRFVRGTVFKSVIASFLTVVILLGVIGGVLWHFRQKAFNILASVYLQENTQSTPAVLVQEVLAEEPEELSTELPKEVDTVVSAVKRANPAVVSVVGVRDIPKYEVSYQQVPNSILKVPQYTQKGTEEKKIGSGSGFIISSDGLIVTNRHVVYDTTARYTIYLNNGANYEATILARDPVLDVAIMKINAGKQLTYLQLADSDTLDVGQSVIAIGNALGELKNTVSVGVISGLSRSVRAGNNAGFSEKLDKVIQTDAAINHGNSGGPLLDLSGKVVGINVAVAEGSESIGFALPINSVKDVINSVKKTGKIERPFIGMRYIAINSEVQEEKKLAVDHGVLIVKGKDATEPAISPNSPAEKAGLKEGDIVLEVDGQRIDYDNEFANIVRVKKIGAIMSLKVLSGGIDKMIYLVIGTAPN